MENEITRFLGAVELFRSLDQEIPGQTIVAFLTIASHPGITVSELGDRLGMAHSTASRQVFTLSKVKTFNQPGYGLVESIENPRNRRERNIHLTSQGERFLNSIKSLLKGGKL
jgi:DNA-binding MarR family transcriptional regulator